MDNAAVNSTRPTLSSLTGLRFFAALWIVCHHYVDRPDCTFIKNFLKEGPRAVPLFFILSGFILTYVYAASSGRFSMRAYFQARFARIYPIYVLGIAAGIPIMLHSDEGLYFRNHTAAVLVSTFTGVQAWFPLPSFLKINIPLWSLSAELFFYVLFPFLLPAVYRLCMKKCGATVLVIASLWSYSLFQKHIYIIGSRIYPGSAEEWPVWGWHPVANLPLFTFGMTLGCIYLFHGKELFSRRMMTAVVMDILVILTVLAIAYSGIIPSVKHFIIPLTGCMLFGLAGSADSIFNRILTVKPIQTAGRASYTLYVLHAPFWHYFRLVYCNILHLGSSTTALPFMASYIGSVLAVSIVVYKLIETPLRVLLRYKTS